MSQEINQSVNQVLGNSDLSSDQSENHFLENFNFRKLMDIREEIYQETQVKPSMKKLVNLIIQESDLQKIRDQLIKQYS